jgi:hypothetical protein
MIASMRGSESIDPEGICYTLASCEVSDEH